MGECNVRRATCRGQRARDSVLHVDGFGEEPAGFVIVSRDCAGNGVENRVSRTRRTGTTVAQPGVFPSETEMTRTVGAALGFLLVVLFFAAVAVESTRAASVPSYTNAGGR